MNEEQRREFTRLIEMSKQQTESLLEDSKKANKAADRFLADSKKQLADSKKQLLAAQSLGLLIGKFVEMSNRRKQCEKQKGTIEFTALEMLDYLMEHRN